VPRGQAPVCIAKTQYSFTTNGDLKGAPADHTVDVREVRLSAGAEFVVAICGEIMTLPGLRRVPAADSIDVGADGKIVGLFQCMHDPEKARPGLDPGWEADIGDLKARVVIERFASGGLNSVAAKL